MPSTYEPVASTTVGSPVSSIVFSSIPQTYTDLRLVLWNRNTNGTNFCRLQINSVTTGYGQNAMRVSGPSANQAGGSTNDVRWYIGWWQSNLSDNVFTLAVVDFFDYTTAAGKAAIIQGFAATPGGAYTTQFGGGYNSTTNPISSITLDTDNASTGAQFATGTMATLYGIKAA